MCYFHQLYSDFICVLAKQFCVLTTAESRAKFGDNKMYLSPPPPPQWFQLLSVLRLLLLLLFVAPIVCGDSEFGPWFVMQYYVSFLVLQSSC